MVASGDDDVHLRTFAMQMDKIVGEALLHRCGRLLDVEDIAADEQCIRAFLLAPLLQLTEEMAVFVASVVVLIDDLS